jgi:hypothetical protein
MASMAAVDAETEPSSSRASRRASSSVGEDEWAARFGALLDRRRKLAAESGWAAATVEDDVAREVASLRRSRAARRR